MRQKKRLAIFYPAQRTEFETNVSAAVAALSEYYEVVSLTENGITPFEHGGMPPMGKREEFLTLALDETIDYLMCWRGGKVDTDGGIVTDKSGSSIQLVDELSASDWTAIEQRRPIVIGRSDLTYLQAAMLNRGIMSYYGPCLESALAAKDVNKESLDTMIRYIRQAIENQTGAVDFLDNCWKVRAESYHGGKAKGRLVGGNLDTIYTAIQTECQTGFPKREPGDIVLLEEIEPYHCDGGVTSEDEQMYRKILGPPELDKYESLRNMGFFDQISGLIIGRSKDPQEYSQGAIPNDTQYLKEVVEKLQLKSVPVILNAACSHTHPMATLPLGRTVTLDADTCTVSW